MKVRKFVREREIVSDNAPNSPLFLRMGLTVSQV